jgi:hypothetical protein
MNQENRLEIQAWLDSELPPQRAAQISNLVQSNDQAKTLADELRMVQSTLRNGETQTQVADTRDFYWSQIELQIEAEEPIPTVEEPKLTPSPVAGLMRWVVPAGSLAAIFALIITFGSLNNFNKPDQQFSTDGPASIGDTVITPSANSGLTEVMSAMEDEKPDANLEIFRFEGIRGSGNLIAPKDPNSLPESIENPER